MKIIVCLALVSTLQLSATVYSQNTLINVDVKSKTVREVLKAIESDSEYRFFYNDDFSSLDEVVDIEVQQKGIKDILQILLQDADLAYRIMDDNMVVILPASELQQMTVSGDVKDENGQPMPGVNVQVEGITGGTTTNVSGKYSIVVPNDEAVLVFTFIGYNELKEVVGGRTVIDVSMELSFEALEEIIVIGYGTQKKKDVTSAIAVVDAKALTLSPVANLTSALVGISPGIEVQSNQARPGELPTVRIRGVSSTNDTDPLYVIDGIPTNNAYINASDVESMQVLKDAASSAIYGSRGANGVILITTKSGQKGAPKISYNGYYGWEKGWKTLDLLNMEQWAAMVTENNAAGGTTAPSLATDIMANGYNGNVTDWQKEIFQTGAITENNIDISGGTESGNYYFSVGQFAQDGIIIDTKYKRYSVRMNSNWHTNKFKFGENISYIFSRNEGEDANGGRSTIEEAIKITPNILVRNPLSLGGFSDYNTAEVGHDASNPVGSLLRASNMHLNKRLMASVYGDLEILKDLNLRTTLGINSTEYQNSNLVLKTNMFPKNYANTTLSESSAWTFNWVWENMMTYHKIIGNHDISVMGAYTSEYTKYHSLGGNGTSIQTETNNILSKTETGYGVSGSEWEVSRISYLGRLMYTFKGKYMLTANFRRDGSSKFGKGNKWGTFPSASLAWRVSDESFMKGIDQISNLKIRASYGVVGNDSPVNAYSYVSGLASGQDYPFNNLPKSSGVTVTGFNNPSITWETVKQFDIGMDIGLFRGAIEATFDYFNKQTEDMIVKVPLPATSGSSGNIDKNLGEILNRGFEFSATVRKKVGEFDISVTGNLTSLHNEITSLGGAPPWNAGAVEFGNATRMEEGQQVGAFYGYKMLGVFDTQEEVTAYVQPGTSTIIQPAARAGDVQWADLNNDGRITADDRYFMGKPIPSLTYGLSANLAYKGFDLSLFFQGVSGNDIYAELVCWTEGMHTNFNTGTKALDRWTPTNTGASVPRAVRNDPNGNIKNISDRYIKDGAYFRLKNASLGYTLPKSTTDFMRISNLRLYVTGRNLLTFTKYPFYDPEIGSGAVGTTGGANQSRGIDNGYYPQARTFILGVQVDF